MTPVARVAYQSGLMVVTAQEAPDDVTGAAGVLDGGCGGGASDELPVPDCLAAGADPAPEPDGAADGEPVLDAGDWPTAGPVVLA
jgi:hypothetical protein